MWLRTLRLHVCAARVLYRCRCFLLGQRVELLYTYTYFSFLWICGKYAKHFKFYLKNFTKTNFIQLTFSYFWRQEIQTQKHDKTKKVKVRYVFFSDKAHTLFATRYLHAARFPRGTYPTLTKYVNYWMNFKTEKGLSYSSFPVLIG